MTSRREQTLELVINALCFWIKNPEGESADELFDRIRDGGASWAIPDFVDHFLVDDDYLTIHEVARELGVATSTVRGWQHRHGLQRDEMQRFRWGDIKKVRQQQTLRNMPKAG